jgi:glycosyltransferase involved in cell wall biosynthesis
MPGEGMESNILERFSVQKGQYILFMGRLVQDKNPDFLIKGFMNSNYKKQNLKLVLAGSNDGDPSYVSYLKSLGNKDVVFTGAVTGADKDTLFR